jgi:hypothetical protein
MNETFDILMVHDSLLTATSSGVPAPGIVREGGSGERNGAAVVDQRAAAGGVDCVAATAAVFVFRVRSRRR